MFGQLFGSSIKGMPAGGWFPNRERDARFRFSSRLGGIMKRTPGGSSIRLGCLPGRPPDNRSTYSLGIGRSEGEKTPSS